MQPHLTRGSAIRTFTSTVTALTSDGKWPWAFHKGDRVTNIRRICPRTCRWRITELAESDMVE
jgi:hypothetical protein